MNKKLLKISKYIFTIIILTIIIYTINNLSIFKGISPSNIQNYINSFGAFSPVIYIILFTFVPLTLFPDSILAIAGGLVFGLVHGFLYTLIGALLGATLSFYIARFLGRDVVKKFFGKKFASLENSLEKNGFFVILLLRLIPLFPFDVISYSAGFSKVKYKDFMLATLIGTMPGILVFVNVGDKSTNIGSSKFLFSIILLVFLICSSLLLKKLGILKKFQA